jgi:L-ribulokinase
MGTSTCDILVAPEEDVNDILVKGICGQVPGSVIPGMMGMEAGQSAFGDAYAWFRNLLMWPLKQMLSQSNSIDADTSKVLIEESESKLIAELSKYAAQLEVNEEDELAVDWFNGRRTPDANQMLEGGFYGLSLGTDAPRMFRAVVESTCFGAKAIVERFIEEKIPVKGLIGMGGVAKKSPFIMQMMADIMQMPIRIHKSEQTCAAGAAMFAATAAGLYDKVEDAMQAMGRGFETTFYPDASKAEVYSKRYERYKKFGCAIEELTLN